MIFFWKLTGIFLSLRQALAALEVCDADSQELPKIIGELFHHFHSFKGISGIAGLEPAEALAHGAEDLLRLMRDGKIQSSEEVLNILNEVAGRLEQVVVAFRGLNPLPDVDSLLSEIKSRLLDRAFSDTTLTRAQFDPARAATTAEKVRSNRSVWRFTFTPSHELSAQKINFNTIREQLLSAGEILKSTPVVIGQGAIKFEFLVAMENAPENLKEWEARGVIIERSEEDLTVAASAFTAAPGPESENLHSPFLAPSHIVRVDLKQLDDLLRIVGEMVIHRSRLELQLSQLNANGEAADLRGVNETNRMLGRSLRQMREDITRIRLVPIAEIFARLPFVVRDLSRQSSKKVRLKITGQETAIDKYLIEKLKDPLLHMVRNAFSHGIEPAEERESLSKPGEAMIELGASIVGDQVIITVRDDGRGINANAIVDRARRLGLDIPNAIDNGAVLNILCSSVFSSSVDAYRTSGRGVGMAVVQAAIHDLGGTLTFVTEQYKGTEFTIRLPLTVVIAETLLVTAAGQTCAVPQSSVKELFRITEAELRKADGIEMVSYRGGVLPITRLANFFQLKSNGNGIWCVLVITSERGSVGLLVEKVLGQRERWSYAPSVTR